MDRKGLGLKAVQWFLRGIQCACAVIILAIYSYILATLSNHNMPIKVSARAVEGISGIALAYTSAAIFFLFCIAGRTMAALLAMALDFSFVVAFIYVAVVNKTGASSCTGQVTTQFGKGNSTERASHAGQKSGFTQLPTYGQACKLESAVLGLSIIAIFFFVFSLLMEVALGRNHWRQKRQNIVPPDPNGPMGPGGISYTSPTVSTPAPAPAPARASFFKRLFSRKTSANTATAEYESMLPQHPTPTDMQERPAPQHSTSGGSTSLNISGEMYQQASAGYVHGGVVAPGYDALAYSSSHVVPTGDLGTKTV
ncbi:hypothetical protein TD95_003110 [Thielaviopsis punctulata]|uniref:MARVEL domain-containing protein n=1 Tax=Thielaviopsis punctulata TaxID=72032 RepID=A0A0F4ZFS6_9PEZI|nr:hypothetical protein TD95_003110 [Thielaviopsis punctulata]